MAEWASHSLQKFLDDAEKPEIAVYGVLGGECTLKHAVHLAGIPGGQKRESWHDGTKPLLLGPSSTNFDGTLMENLVFDGGADVLSDTSGPLLQLTNVKNLVIRGCTFRNNGGAGVVIQSHNKGEVVNVTIENCHFENLGLADGTTGFGLLLQGNVQKVNVLNCSMVGIKGGMGIAGNHTSDGGVVDAIISGNSIRMAPSKTDFEAIGFTAGCKKITVAHNVIIDSRDNGISVSGPHSIVHNNVISGTVNFGIELEDSTGCAVTGNYMRGVGREESSLEYGYIKLGVGKSNGLVANNVGQVGVESYDQKPSFAVKNSGKNIAVGNYFEGFGGEGVDGGPYEGPAWGEVIWPGFSYGPVRK